MLDLLASSARFPRLESLRLAYALLPFRETFSSSQEDLFPFDERVQDAWCVPWEELLGSRLGWLCFEVTVPTDWEACFQERRRRKRKLQTSDFM